MSKKNVKGKKDIVIYSMITLSSWSSWLHNEVMVVEGEIVSIEEWKE